ncbi:hypothetical protein TRFO_29942 [Tritrichomonas foetus]|uniref:AAA+ ATPase domain-containing protein n=1 Tax=Tritrichomonas foetus TaxID=1144522 RepID=A0A1J4JUY1_9EUKA|nr:hypothetical protein TRFO_29942 [Tritrichomonas foetus]|eukprot:OHT02811.1 hypothetical protein TRFO_29942 [Tritrichomonas foetus]
MQFIVDRVSDPYDLCVYIHHSKLTSLSINEGEIVRIRSRARKDVIATVRAAKRTTFPISNIQLGRCLRQNLCCYLGQIVLVEPFRECQPADKVLLNPIEDTIHNISGNFIDIIKSSKYNFIDLPIQPEMIIPIHALGHIFEFKVSHCSPTSAVIISNVNNLQVNNHPVARPKGSHFQGHSYDDIGGMKKTIKDIRRSIELPLMQPQIFQMVGLTPHRGLLLVAPQGCGKTFLSTCIKNETPVHYQHIPCVDLLAKSPEDTSIILRKLCDRAISKAPAVVFFDDIDKIAMDQRIIIHENNDNDENSNNESFNNHDNFDFMSNDHQSLNGDQIVIEKRLKYSVLANIDRLLSVPSEKSIIVIATATSLENITPELLLSNRLAHTINISKPSRKERIDILSKLTRCYTISAATSLEELVNMFESKTGSDLQLNVQKLVQLKTMDLLDKIVRNKGQIQIDDLKSIVISRVNYSDLVKNTTAGSIENAKNQGSNRSISFNDNNNNNNMNPSNSNNNNNNPFSQQSNFASPFSAPSNQSQNQSNQIQQQPANPFGQSADPFAPNQPSVSPFGGSQPNSSNDVFSQPRPSSNDPFNTQKSQTDPFAVKPKDESVVDPFAQNKPQAVDQFSSNNPKEPAFSSAPIQGTPPPAAAPSPPPAPPQQEVVDPKKQTKVVKKMKKAKIKAKAKAKAKGKDKKAKKK